MDNESKQAVQIAMARMAAEGQPHGPCISVERRFPDSWQVDLAWNGYEGHSPTTDPSSLTLFVDIASGAVRNEMEEYLHRREHPFP